jgi:hypothetical protein
MLTSLRMTFALLAMTVVLAAPAYPQESAKPQESPWAMRAPASPQAAPTLSAAEIAAKKQAEKGTPDQQAFARKVADAMSSKDVGAMKQLFAPATLQCIGKNQDFVQDRIKRQLDLPISRKFNLKITRLPPNIMNASKYSTYPMQATHLMQMQFTNDDGDHHTVNLPIGQEGGKWYEAQPCPTEAGMERFAKLQHMRAVAHERAKASVAQLKDPVKAQILALIAKHDSVSAWRLCMASLRDDFPTCRGVVAILAGDPNY